MSRVPLIELEDASPEVREIYEDIIRTRKEGLTKSFKASANNIHVLRAKWARHKSLLHSETYLPYKMREAIQLVVAKTVGCQA